MSNLLFRDESYAIIGACFEVYKQKGCGFTEPIYQACLAAEFQLRGIPFTAQHKIPLRYKGQSLDKYFLLDFLCFERVVVELKALPKLLSVNKAQAVNYLCETDFDLALLVNFGAFPKLEYERIINGRKMQSRSLKDEIRSWNEPPS